MTPLELWGGVECALSRIGDNYIDQCAKSNYDTRIGDLQHIRELGIQKLRYPCLWEKVAPKELDSCDWSFLDKELSELNHIGISFIAGFLHYGSGPYYTGLIDPEFPQKFSTYARKFGQRFPWVELYTPIHEINTTARLSCLDGKWYPHLNNATYYLKALIHQCKATILAMRELRSINHRAQLIQTDDIISHQSTLNLGEWCWLSFDLLSGKIGRDHSLYLYFLDNGIRREELSWFEENSYPPDIIEINCARDRSIQPQEMIRKTWKRYHTPISVTLSHAEKDMPSQFWKECQELRLTGVEIRAVSFQNLLGSNGFPKTWTSQDDHKAQEVRQ